MFNGEQVDMMFAELFILLTVIACELVSFFDGIFFLILSNGKYVKIYFALIIVCAGCFIAMAYQRNADEI